MRLRVFILLFIGVLAAVGSYGQAKTEYTQSRILILLDESSSMLQPWSGGKEKHKIANQLILKLIDSVYSVNRNVEFSLRVFGSQYSVPEHNCQDTKNEVPFSKYNKTQMEFRLDDIQPYGITSIAYSLSEAADKDLVDAQHIAYSIVLVTDGGESCNGDICAVMAKLLKNKIYFKPYILSLEDVAGLKEEYACMGNYLPVTKKSDIDKSVGIIVESFRPMLTISKEEYSILQKANIPSVLKVGSTKVTVEKKDTVKPKPIVKPIPVDTVAVIKPEPPKSKIIVDEVVKLPPATKLKRIAFGVPKKLFTAPPAPYRTKDVAVTGPEIKLPEPPPALPEAVKMASIKPSAIRKYRIAKQEPFNTVDVLAGMPVIKEQVEAPVAVKMVMPSPAKIKKLPTTKVAAFTPQDVTVAAPQIKEPEPTPVAPTPIKLAGIKPSKLKKIGIEKLDIATPKDIAIAAPQIKIKEPEVVPVAATPIKMAKVMASKMNKIALSEKATTFVPKNVVVVAPEIKIQAPESVVPEVTVERVKMAKIRPSKVSKWHLLYGGEFFDEKLKIIKISQEPSFKPIATTITKPVVVPPVVKPGEKKLNPAVNTGEYSVTQEDAKETSMAVYLTNGKGKYYAVTPKVVLTDAVTNKPIKTFTRFVDADGQPDPIKNIAAGKYYLTIEGRDDLIASVDLMPNKRTRVEIIVKKYSLYFYYIGAPNRPVTEFNARVIQRNVPNGKIVEQHCTEKLQYEPGNYHININTFPEDVRNIDLESDSEGGIGISEPGFAKFTNDVKAASLTLHKQLGDRFVQFYTLNLSDPASQHLQIQPGKYQAQYNNGTSKFSSSVKSVEFFVKSNKETEVILK